MKMAKNMRWWFLLHGNSILANSSKPCIRAILLQFNSIFVLGVIFTPYPFVHFQALLMIFD
jgi:hypothetical protein